ncbi:MAG: alkaline phosphatase PhoX [Catalinimonas sp.]
MKRILLSLLALGVCSTAFAQLTFTSQIILSDSAQWVPDAVVMPPSPLKSQILFIGSVDSVQTRVFQEDEFVDNGAAASKQWHDFIGFTADDSPEAPGLGWVTVNHELIEANDKIGDGGGMTVFYIGLDEAADTITILDQTLTDGRQGKYFNVDFQYTVGETGMNCGGITSPDGRIWTAEEWFRRSNGRSSSIYAGGSGVRDTNDVEFRTDIPALTDANGTMLKKYETFNYMVEIDPRRAEAIRKQYNWGRQGFEGGAIATDNRTVYLGEDATPGLFSKFVADEPGDFTQGKLYVYTSPADDQPGPEDNWIEVPQDLDTMLYLSASSYSINPLKGGIGTRMGAAMFNRIEWVVIDTTTGKVYWTETGNDNPSGALSLGNSIGGTMPPTWIELYRQRYFDMNGTEFTGTDENAIDSVLAGRYRNYYGHVAQYDPATGEVEVLIAGGPYYATSAGGTQDSLALLTTNYPDKHLSNPDGLNILYVNGKRVMIICEDLNGSSNGRMPSDLQDVNRTCELWALDMDLIDAESKAKIDDLQRISVVPAGAEVTGACPLPDGSGLLVNSQHPSTNNEFPYNNSLTYIIRGFDNPAVITSLFSEQGSEAGGFYIYPNPTARELNFSEFTDVAIYDQTGRRIRVIRNRKHVDVSNMKAGVYYVRNVDGQTRKLVIQ